MATSIMTSLACVLFVLRFESVWHCFKTQLQSY